MLEYVNMQKRRIKDYIDGGGKISLTESPQTTTNPRSEDLLSKTFWRLILIQILKYNFKKISS